MKWSFIFILEQLSLEMKLPDISLNKLDLAAFFEPCASQSSLGSSSSQPQ